MREYMSDLGLDKNRKSIFIRSHRALGHIRSRLLQENDQQQASHHILDDNITRNIKHGPYLIHIASGILDSFHWSQMAI